MGDLSFGSVWDPGAKLRWSWTAQSIALPTTATLFMGPEQSAEKAEAQPAHFYKD